MLTPYIQLSVTTWSFQIRLLEGKQILSPRLRCHLGSAPLIGSGRSRARMASAPLTHLWAQFGCPAAKDLEEAVDLVGVSAKTGQQKVEVGQARVLVVPKIIIEGDGGDVLGGVTHLQREKFA